MTETGPRIQLGILPWGQATSWVAYLETALRVEGAGHDHLWSADHLLADWGPPGQPVFESWVTLAAWASRTQRITLGHLVGANTFRAPALVAKMAATLDHVSDGRFILGLGAAWFELEHHAHGIEPGFGPRERLAWLDEAIGIIRRLLDGAAVSHAGQRYRLDRAHHAPTPIQAHLPVLIGGVGERHTLRVVARHADIWNAIGSPDDLRRKAEILLRHCEREGRDPATITRSVDVKAIVRDEPAEARRVWGGLLAANGVTSFKEPDPLLGPPELIAARLHEYVSAGFRHIVVEVPAPHDAETIERLVSDVKPLLLS